MSDTATSFAPASIGNVGVGFDMLGLAIEGAGDRVTAKRTERLGVSLTAILDSDGAPLSGLSPAANENTASIAAGALWDSQAAPGGLELELRKGIPLQSGMGSSAASAVAGVVAANAMLPAPLPLNELLPFALEGERYASKGLHADNVAPSLFGGLVLCPNEMLPDIVRLPTPAGIKSVLLHPDLAVNTAESRKQLAKTISVDAWLQQQGFLAGFIAACASGDLGLLRKSFKDVVIEPQRAANVPCFAAVQAAALQAGALGCTLSGSGPSLFALCPDAAAPSVARAMSDACRETNIDCQTWISALDAPGARIES